jgi:PAS domain S-box-containing protein
VLTTAAQGRFAAEFATFLVTTAGLSLVRLRPELLSRFRWARTLLTVGFAALGTTSFLLGSLLVADQANVAANIVQGAGLIALGVGAVGMTGSPTPRRLVWGALILLAIALALTADGYLGMADIMVGAGAVVLGVALLAASRQSVAARVAASAAGTLLVIMLVLSSALSSVVTDRIQKDAYGRLSERAATESELIQNTGTTNALLIARASAQVMSNMAPAVMDMHILANTPHPQMSPDLSRLLEDVRQSLLPQDSLLYVSPTGATLGVAQSDKLDQDILNGVVGSVPVRQVVSSPLTRDSERGTVEVINGKEAVAIGVEPVAISDPITFDPLYPGVLVAVQPLDRGYISVRTDIGNAGQAGCPSVDLALVSSTTVLADSGCSDRNALMRLAKQALVKGTKVETRVGNHFFDVRVVSASDGRPVMALALSIPTTAIANARDELFRTLFIIALGGTLLALLLAAVVGERIGADLRTLTEAAQRIQRGEATEPVGVRTDDEVGVLGGAFDSMATAISAQTTALQQAADDETALRNQLEAVVAGMGEALIAVNGEGRVTLLNRAAEELLEVEASTAVGKWVDDVVMAAADDGGNVTARLRRPTPARWQALATLVPHQGPPIPVAISTGALRGPSGSVVGAVFVVRDLRPEREVERMKSQFLSRIGHELRTPLTAILGYADILLRRQISQDTSRQFHEEIFEAGKRLSRIVEMLEFSAAVETGRSLMRPERTSVRSVLDEVVTGWEGRLNGDHAIARRVGGGLPDIVADRRWLALAINELIDNAVKFSPHGGDIEVTAFPMECDGRSSVEISVVDHGVGMTSAEESRVFADFTQGDGSDTRRFGGLGLGLSLVRRVAEAHDGSVRCTSSLGDGSTFSIVVPS